MEVFSKYCSVCRIDTSERLELIPCRDVLKHLNSAMAAETPYYDMFMEKGQKDFLKMQIFDILTLNTDRNRDNFAFKKENGKITGLYPIFDHDSCFKGKSMEGIYFVTRKTFSDSLSFLSNTYPSLMKSISSDIKNLEQKIDKKEMEELIGTRDTDGFMERVERVREEIGKIKTKEIEYSYER